MDSRAPPASSDAEITNGAANAEGANATAAAPNATLQMVPDCGHLPHLEYPEVFNAAVTGVWR